MTDPNIYKEYAATPGTTLEQYIMDPRHPKSEAEWWASREITRLREENERLKAALEDVLSDIAKSEHVNNLYPSPGKSRFWKSVVNAEKLLK